MAPSDLVRRRATTAEGLSVTIGRPSMRMVASEMAASHIPAAFAYWNPSCSLPATTAPHTGTAPVRTTSAHTA